MVEYLYLNSGKGLFKVAASSKLTKHAVTPLSWGSILTFEGPELGHVSVYAACRSIHLCARKESAFQLVLFLLLCSLWLVLLCPSWGEHRSIDGWIATIWKISKDADVHASSFFCVLISFSGITSTFVATTIVGHARKNKYRKRNYTRNTGKRSSRTAQVLKRTGIDVNLRLKIDVPVQQALSVRLPFALYRSRRNHSAPTRCATHIVKLSCYAHKKLTFSLHYSGKEVSVSDAAVILRHRI